MSENYLIHYGVKGMKWGKHVKATYDDVVKTSRDIGRTQTKTVGLNAYNGYFDRDDPARVANTLFRRAEGYHPDDEYDKQANAIYDAHQKAKLNNFAIKQNYETGLKAKAKTYEEQRANTSKKQELDAAKVRASKDLGRVQTKTAALNVSNGYFDKDNPSKIANTLYLRGDGYHASDDYNKQASAIAASAAMAKVKASDISSKIAAYDAKTQANVKKITSGKTSVSQIATSAAAKAKTLVSNMFGKKKGK